jgi:hydrogenase maturation protease
MNKDILILGVGNDILTDDGIGPKIVKQLSQEIIDDRICFDNVCLGGLEILEYIRGYKYVYFIDAIKTIDGKIGDVYFLQTSDFKETSHLSNLHDVSFLTALKMGEELNFDIPLSIRIAAVEILEDMEFNVELTPQLAEKYDEAYYEVHSEIQKWLDEISAKAFG